MEDTKKSKLDGVVGGKKADRRSSILKSTTTVQEALNVATDRGPLQVFKQD
jgi:hypothetical protein